MPGSHLRMNVRVTIRPLTHRQQLGTHTMGITQKCHEFSVNWWLVPQWRSRRTWPKPCSVAVVMQNALKLQSEPQLETNPCPLCGESEGTPIADRVAGGHTLDTQSCIQCGAVYQSSSWTSDELLSEYEGEQLGDSAVLVLPIPEGTIGCSDPHYERVRNAQLTGRAHNAITLGYMQTGDRVLQLGCGSGETLTIQREALGVECFGVEVSAELAALATEEHIDTTLTTFDSPDFLFEELDVIEAFHFLQRVPDPLQWLMRSWECLAVGGRIVVEVPNLYHPQGSLDEVFLRPGNLHYWSESTLSALLERAGFTVERVVSTLTLFVVGRKESPEQRDVPYSRQLLTHPEHNHEWIVTRLKSYGAMERIRQTMRKQGPNMDLLHQLVHQLMRPAFGFHVVTVGLDLIDFFLNHRAVGLACLLATAASDGPYEKELTERFAKLAKVIREEGITAVGLPSPAKAPTPARTLATETEKNPTKVVLPERTKVRELMRQIREEFAHRPALQVAQRAPFQPGGPNVVHA
jgi:SAM-dependent methyltransferase